MRVPLVLLVTLSAVAAACSPAPPPTPSPGELTPIAVAPRCPDRPFDSAAPLGPEFDEDIFLRDESKVLATDFLVGLAAIYAHPDAADVCRYFTERGWTTALAFDPRLRAVERGEAIVTQEHVLRLAIEGEYNLRNRPPVVPLEIVFDIPAGARTEDVTSGETRITTSTAREGFHADLMFDGERWRVDQFGPLADDNRTWIALPTTPAPGPPCATFVHDPEGAPFDDSADRPWCDAAGRGRAISRGQVVLLTQYPCKRGKAAILHIGRPLGASLDPLVRWEYVRDPGDEFLGREWITAPYEDDATMPDDAADSGWTNGNIDLWISPSDLDRAVYVVRGDTIERWPRAVEQWGVIDCN